MLSMLFWIIISGVSLLRAVLGVAVVLGVCFWGVALVQMLSPMLIRRGEFGLWLLGPSLGFGALALLVVRLFVPTTIFLSAFPLVATASLVRVLGTNARDKLECLAPSGPNPASYSLVFFAVGMPALTWVHSWRWSAGVVLVAITAFAITTRIEKFRPLISAFLLLAVIVAAYYSTKELSFSWWQAAEGVPHDEPILEAVSNGLIQWGPLKNPIFHSLDGAPSLAYHHLTYMVVGLINRFAPLEPYVALLKIMPVISGISVTSSLLLLLGRVSKISVSIINQHLVAVVGLAATLMTFRGPGFGSPSVWFSLSPLVAALVLIIDGCLSKTQRSLLTLGFSVLVVAFSKGTFTYVPVLFASVMAAFDIRGRWRVAVTTVSAGVATSAWFALNQIASQTFSIDLWPKKVFGSEFSLSTATFFTFIEIVLIPLILGLVASVLSAVVVRGPMREISIALLAVMITSVSIRLLLTSSGPNSEELFYTAGIFAASLALPISLLAIAANQRWSYVPSVPWIFGSAIVAAVATWLAPKLGPASLTGGSAVATIAAIALGALALMRRQSASPNSYRELKFVTILACVVSLTAISVSARDDMRRASQDPQRQQSDWYGNSDFRSAVVFVKAKTNAESIIAYSVTSSDYRPAALTTRRFLALSPLFKEHEASDQLWNDVRLSLNIGQDEPEKTLAKLRDRAVSFLWIDRRSVSDSWIEGLKTAGAQVIFQNKGYVIAAT